MLRVVTVAALAVALLGAGLGVYDHQHIQRSIDRARARASTAPRAQSRGLHKQENKQQSRDILFGTIAGLGLVIALSSAVLIRVSGRRRRGNSPETSRHPETAA